MYDYGKKIKYLRNINGISGYELSILLDINRSTISNIENGRNFPSVQLLEKICTYFEITLVEFFVETPEIGSVESKEEKLMISLWRNSSKEVKNNILNNLKDQKKIEIINSDSESIAIINAYRMASEPEKMAINALLNQYKPKSKVLKKNA